jgi:hypothetical protein
MFRVRYARPAKYHNKKTQCSDHWHPSKLEAKVCGELALRAKAGDIKYFERQVRVRLEIDGLYLGTCIPDFLVYHHDGSREYVEAKGMEMHKWKRDWKILQHMHRDDPTVKFSVIKR